MNTMKHPFQIFFSAVSVVLLIHACTYKDSLSPVEDSTVRTLPSLTKSVANGSTPVFKEKPKVITREALDDILAKGFQGTSVKNTKRYSLKTISEEGKPIIHSVNFTDGGWALVAGRELPNNQIIAYGEEGVFDPDNIESPEVLFWFNMTQHSLKTIFEKADWEAESKSDNNNALKEESNRSFSYDDPYVWVRMDLGTQNSSVITYLNHLTETTWGQGYPWNYKCPIVNYTRCPVGCVAVAVAQLLYYFHFHLGTPSGCYHTVDVSYTWNSSGYYTSNVARGNYTAPSPRWNAMAQTNPSVLTTGAQYVGDLMIDVADRLGTHFATSGSSAIVSPDVFPYYNIDCSSLQPYNSSQTIAQLNDSIPVLVYGAKNNGEGHAWLIDGYKKQETVTDHQYKWVIMPPDSLQYHNNINYYYVFTEAEMQQFYPDIEENEIVHEYSYSAPTYYYRMNWGWNGNFNDDYYAIIPDDKWIYKLDVCTITGFTN